MTFSMASLFICLRIAWAPLTSWAILLDDFVQTKLKWLKWLKLTCAGTGKLHYLHCANHSCRFITKLTIMSRAFVGWPWTSGSLNLDLVICSVRSKLSPQKSIESPLDNLLLSLSSLKHYPIYQWPQSGSMAEHNLQEVLYLWFCPHLVWSKVGNQDSSLLGQYHKVWKGIERIYVRHRWTIVVTLNC